MWKAYPDLHKMGMTIEKGSKDYREVLYRWGTWANAKKELARHGVEIRQSKEGVHSRWVVRDLTTQLTQMTGNPSEKAYVPEYLLDRVRPVVMLANDAIGNHEAAKKLAESMGGVYGPVPAGTNILEAVSELGLSSMICRK